MTCHYDFEDSSGRVQKTDSTLIKYSRIEKRQYRNEVYRSDFDAIMSTQPSRRTDDKPKLQCASEDHGMTMMRGEHTSIATIYTLMPDLLPTPHGWGKYKLGSPNNVYSSSPTLSTRQGQLETPEPSQPTAGPAETHQKSTSPNGKVQLPRHDTRWQDVRHCSLGSEPSDLLRKGSRSQARKPMARGRNREAAAQQVKSSSAVIPRLLGALQSGGGRELEAEFDTR